MRFWEGFAKYVGIQGIVFLGLAAGFIAAPFVGVELPDIYTDIMSLTAGFYFAKNGPSVVRGAAGAVGLTRSE